MKIMYKTLKLKTKRFIDFVDITDRVKKVVERSKIKNGMVMIFSKHTTAAIRINERESGIVKDFERFARKILPPDKYYHHNDLNIRTENLVCEAGASDCLNGHSHCLHLLMGASSEMIPIMDKELVFGQWQRIFIIELDRARPRKVFVKVMGE